MAYQSLYRKYRPQRFEELVGQGHVTAALRNAVREGRVGHAYLFSGPRGTGKTSTARILAKALNCTALSPEGEPCGECENCVSITEGRFFDIRELDAASNRGIDNIREVIESTALGLGPGSRHKLYVLDEVHMLTEPASNALLKTLEEAPAHVVFVLATTNPEKVLPTIRSRTQHYEFTLLSKDELIGRLGALCEREGVMAEPAALETIAIAAAGSARDGESLLDQVLAHGPVEAAAVDRLLGGSAVELRAGVLDAIAGEDAPGALVALGRMLEAGHEPRRVAEDLLAATRDAFLLTAGGGRVKVELPADAQERLHAIGEALGNAALVRTIETLGQAVTDMRGTEAADPRLVLEVALVRLSRRDAGPPLQMVMERIERLERAVAEGTTPGGSPPRAGAASAPSAATAPPPARPSTEGAARREPGSPRRTIAALRQERTGEATAPDAGSPAVEAAPAVSSGPVEPAGPEPTPAVPEPAAPPASAPPEPPSSPAPGAEVDIDDVILAWGGVLPELPVATRAAVQAAQPLRIEGDVLVFGVPPAVLEAARLRIKKEAETIRQALTARVGRAFKFSLVPAPEFSLTGAGAPASAGGPDEPPAEEAPPELDEDIDLSESVEADASDGTALSLLRDRLGATVVEEGPRDS